MEMLSPVTEVQGPWSSSRQLWIPNVDILLSRLNTARLRNGLAYF